MDSTAKTSTPLAVGGVRQAALSAASAVPRPVAVAATVLLFAAATAVGARIAVPLGFTPVPMTLQTFVVLLAGALLGPRAGAASQLTYLAVGAAGVPVFAAGGAGLPWLLGPTGGYLLAFPLAAAAVGWIAGPDRAPLRVAAGLAVGTGAIFALGTAWLAGMTGAGPREAFALAVQPFVAGAAIKAAAAFVVVRGLTAGRRLAGLGEHTSVGEGTAGGPDS